MTYSMSRKEKYIQPRILYLAKFSFRIEGEIKNFPDKVKGVHHHWTGYTRNVKGTSSSRKEKAITKSKKLWKKKPHR